MSGFHIQNLGCKVNRVDADRIAAELIAAGFEMSGPQDAALVIVNTCTVTGEADAKSRKAVRRALLGQKAPSRREPSLTGGRAVDGAPAVCPPGADGTAPARTRHVLVTGCSATANPGQFDKLGEHVLVIPDRDKATSLAKELLAQAGARKDGLEQAGARKDGLEQAGARTDGREQFASKWARGAGFNTRVGVKAQDGCDNSCSYCIVPVARGRARSRPMAEVLGEVAMLAANGASELVLTGINLGAYASEGGGLTALLQAALRLPGGFRMRLSSIEPQDLSRDLLELIAGAHGRICAHLALPLQSGSDRVLNAMRRPYTAAEYLDKVAMARSLMPQLSITTDVIVGFPGESEADFEESCRVCELAAFSKIHVFRYSRRETTIAAAMPGQVDANVKSQRSAQLRALAARLAAEDCRRRVGTVEQVIVEGDGGMTSESYHEVALDPACGRLHGELEAGGIVRMRFTANEGARLLGVPMMEQ